MAKKKRRQSITNKIMTQVVEIQNEKTPHDLSRKNYIRNTKRFIKFCREQYDCKDFESCREHIQDYCDYLQEQGYSASTIHTYIASVTSTFSIPMSEIRKPIRHIGEFTRGRENILNRTNQDFNNPEYDKVVEFQKRVGIRRNELKNLTGDCLVRDESGYYTIYVKHGKGNKLQHQRLNSKEDEEFIKQYFDGKAPDEQIFTEKDINNDLNFHLLRAKSAQEFYDIQLTRILNEPGYAEQLTNEIIKRWNATNFDKLTGKVKPFNKQKLEGWYVCRGSVRKAAIENGRPIKYNRLAVIATSMMRLSHYRANVTVQNYLIL